MRLLLSQPLLRLQMCKGKNAFFSIFPFVLLREIAFSYGTFFLLSSVFYLFRCVSLCYWLIRCVILSVPYRNTKSNMFVLKLESYVCVSKIPSNGCEPKQKIPEHTDMESAWCWFPFVQKYDQKLHSLRASIVCMCVYCWPKLMYVYTIHICVRVHAVKG